MTEPTTQTNRLVTYLRYNPGASSYSITLACRIVNVTGRVSDARAQGHVIDAIRGEDGVFVLPPRSAASGRRSVGVAAVRRWDWAALIAYWLVIALQLWTFVR